LKEVIPKLVSIIDATLADLPQSERELRVSRGKCVYELSPKMEWNKGKAVNFLLERLGYNDMASCVPVYIGDDTSDERAFEAFKDKHLAVIYFKS